MQNICKPLDFWGKMCYKGVAEQSRAVAIAILSTKKYYNVEDTPKLLMPLGL